MNGRGGGGGGGGGCTGSGRSSCPLSGNSRPTPSSYYQQYHHVYICVMQVCNERTVWDGSGFLSNRRLHVSIVANLSKQVWFTRERCAPSDNNASQSSQQAVLARGVQI